MKIKNAIAPHMDKFSRFPLWAWGLAAIAMIASIIFWKYEFNTKTTTHIIQSVPVMLAAAQLKEVPLYLSALGTVTPIETVTVIPRIDGELLQVFFNEGQLVKKDELLAEIDARTYEAQLIQYEGQLLRDQALLANARLDLKRYEDLFKEDSIAKQILDTQEYLVHQYMGEVMSDLGQIESAKTNLAYAKVVSPIDGVVGLRQIDPGNFIQTSDLNGLVVINKLDPITVVFSIPEDSIQKVLAHANTGRNLRVEAYDRSQKKLLAVGTLLSMDNQIDPSTGTVKLKAQFQNEEHILFPNQFVNIRLQIETLPNAVLVPSTAIQYGSKGSYIYVLDKGKSSVKLKIVELGANVGSQTVISSGILENEEVVVEGADKLMDGTLVKTRAGP